MNTLNGWTRLWGSMVFIYLMVVLGAAYMMQPTKNDVSLEEVLPYISDGILEKLAQPDGSVWRPMLVDGIKISIPAMSDLAFEKSYTAEYLAGNEAVLSNKRLAFVALASAYWVLPSILLLAVGHLAAWVRRGFAEQPH
ncbi:hypothetical protein [Roseateles oligotrophus]|uniref:Uncharacterized protein n=1 Tax=Roseateles oligotrophus TaxID=1769250 RepID=A0ABT2YBF0_9BURK|nr:hypothetical protein [Roseateles oligotrophus]MCV2367022.1 hypothetical protein [Roseateles oligotrophus]